MAAGQDSKKELVIKVVAMPSDMNPGGDMFGGWIVSQMDLAAYLFARKYAQGRIVTVAIDNLVFHKPVYVGDCVICYASLEKIGRTSITLNIEVMVERRDGYAIEKVTEGRFVFVAVGEDMKPVPIQNTHA